MWYIISALAGYTLYLRLVMANGGADEYMEELNKKEEHNPESLS